MTTSQDEIGKGGGGGRGGGGGGGRGPRGGGGGPRGGGGGPRGFRGGFRHYHRGPGTALVYDPVPIFVETDPVYDAEFVPPHLLVEAEKRGEKRGWARAMMSRVGAGVTALGGGVASLADDLSALADDFSMLNVELDLLGAEVVGEGYGDMFSSVFKAAGDVAQTGMNIYEKDKAQKAQTAADEAKVKQAVKADQDATAAAIRANLSKKLSDGKPQDATLKEQAELDAGTAATLAQAQAQAGAGLNEAGQSQRLQAARDALQAAMNTQKSGDAASLAKVRAWQTTVNKLVSQGLAGPSSSDSKPGRAQDDAPAPSWFKGKTGPIPNTAIAAGGGLVAAIVALKLLKAAL